jgi:hypothetical protein
VQIFLLTALLATSLELSANDFQRGLEALARDEHQLALDLFRPLAEGGHARAQFALGVAYYEGTGSNRDPATAASWFERSANQGYAPAQFNLGNSYRYGDGVPQDDGVAAAWWTKAAAQEFANAQYNLATLYYFGRGVERDQATALAWFRKAAANGSEPARRILDLAPDGPLWKVKREDWILAQDADYFTVQLFAGHNEEALLRFIEKHSFDETVAYFRTVRDGRPWFSLIYGVYTSADAARGTLGQLSGPIRTTSPWIRSFAGIHRSLDDSWQAGLTAGDRPYEE